MPTELLPATYPTEEAAREHSRYFTHRSIDQRKTKIVPSREKPGRWQVRIYRVTKEEQEAAAELI